MDSQLLSKVLWDINQDKISDLPDSFVMRRVFSYGNISLIFSMLRMYGKAVVAQEFSQMKPSSMNARRYHYLQECVFQKVT